MKAGDFFEHLMGSWSFYRKLIVNDAKSLSGTVNGTVVVVQIAVDQLHYQENGQFISTQGTFNIQREYIYEYVEKEDKMEKFFCQNREKQGLFYSLVSDNRLLSTTNHLMLGKHLCAQDTYVANYLFEENNTNFTLTYKVSGPQKNYYSETTYFHPDAV